MSRTSARRCEVWTGIGFRRLVVGGALAWSVTAVAAVSAAVVTVNDCGDSGGATQLRGRITAAAAEDVIVLPACTIVLVGASGDDANVSGDLDISVDLTLVGAGPAQTIIDGGGVDRVIHVLAGVTSIAGLTIRNGAVVGSLGGGTSVAVGASLSLVDVAVIGNQTNGSGGGIFSEGRLTLTRVTVADNSAGDLGGGIAFDVAGAIISDSVISGNRAAVGGGIANAGTMTLTSVVIAGNHVEGAGTGGGFESVGGQTFFRRVVLARNAVTAGAPGTADCEILAGSIVSHGHNRIGTNCGIGTTTGDLVGVNPVLAGDVLVAAGAGGGPHVRVLDVATGADVLGFFAYDAGFTGGARVTACDLDTDGVPDIVTGAGPGGGPHVRAFSGVGGAPLPGPIGSFFAYAPAFTGGVFVGCWDVDRDGVPDVVTGAGAGGGPHVRVFSGRDGSEIFGVFAFAPAFTGGVFVGP